MSAYDNWLTYDATTEEALANEDHAEEIRREICEDVNELIDLLADELAGVADHKAMRQLIAGECEAFGRHCKKLLDEIVERKVAQIMSDRRDETRRHREEDRRWR